MRQIGLKVKDFDRGRGIMFMGLGCFGLGRVMKWGKGSGLECLG